MLLITGCGRSGTQYASKVLREMCVDSRHECFKSGGTEAVVSWYLGVLDPAIKPIQGPELDFVPTHVVHLIREPLKVMVSCNIFSRRAWAHIASVLGDRVDTSDRVLRGIQYWYEWNKMIEDRLPSYGESTGAKIFTVRTPDIKVWLKGYVKTVLQKPWFDSIADNVSTSTNGSSRPFLKKRTIPITVEDVKRYGYYDRVKEMANRHELEFD